MCIKNLSVNEHNIVAGGNDPEGISNSPIVNEADSCLTANSIIDNCLEPIRKFQANEKLVFTSMRIPTMKPDSCPYEAWGLLKYLESQIKEQ